VPRAALKPRGAIQAGGVYPQRVFMRLLGIGPSTFRRMTREGLPVREYGGRRFVLGHDAVEFFGRIDAAHVSVAKDGGTNGGRTQPRN